jgi:hypothetical protein
MGGLVGGSKSPPPPRMPEPVFTAAPTRDSAEVNADAVAERARRVSAAGRGSTLLAGTSDEAAPDRKKALLGG